MYLLHFVSRAAVTKYSAATCAKHVYDVIV